MNELVAVENLYAHPPQERISIEDCAWYHQFDFLDFSSDIVATYDIRGLVDKFMLPEDLTGKRCLDIGTASGFFTFEMERRGAEVVSFDLGPGDMWDQVPFDWLMSRPHHVRAFLERQRRGYWYAHKYFLSSAKLAHGNVMNIPTALGAFDLVFIGAILQHVHDPIGAIIGAAKLAKETLIISEALGPSGTPTMLFQPHAEKGQYWTWWTFSPETFVNLLRCLGFSQVEVSQPFDQILKESGGRVPSFTIRATRPKYPKYERGTQIDLRQPECPYLITGWDKPTHGGRRMLRPEAPLGFDINQPNERGNLTVEVGDRGNVPDDAVLEIYVNRKFVGSMLLAEQTTGTFPVSEDIMRDAANKTVSFAVMTSRYPFWLPQHAVKAWPAIRQVRMD